MTLWDTGFVNSFAKMINGEKSQNWIYNAFPLYTGTIKEQKCSVVSARVGASAMVMYFEELVACSAHTIINIGFAGSLQKSNPIGSIIIPTDCICEEGTSQHYWNGSITPDLKSLKYY